MHASVSRNHIAHGLCKTYFLISYLFHIFQGPCFSGSRFFRVRVQGLGPDFRSSLLLVLLHSLQKVLVTCWNIYYMDVAKILKISRCKYCSLIFTKTLITKIAGWKITCCKNCSYLVIDILNFTAVLSSWSLNQMKWKAI